MILDVLQDKIKRVIPGFLSVRVASSVLTGRNQTCGWSVKTVVVQLFISSEEVR